MKITYIHHSSFSVELDNTILLFDYFKGNLPSFDKNKSYTYFLAILIMIILMNLF